MSQDMSGKTIIITGANSGLGKASAITLAGMGARLLLVCRDKGRGEAALGEIRAAARD